MDLIRDAIYGLVAIVASPVWVYRLAQTGKWRTDWAARFGRAPAAEGDRPTVLIHAVSVGEVNATRLLVQRLEEKHGDALLIVIATTTDTGTARARQLYGGRHMVVRYPLDFSGMVRRFLDAVRPDVVVLVELEVWPTFVSACQRRGIPVAVINGRLSERSYKRYRMIQGLVASTFGKLAAVAAQDEAYRERFVGLGVTPERVEVTGTMKWDTATIQDEVPGSSALAEAMGIDLTAPLIVCGSTGPGEEKLFLEKLGDLTGQRGGTGETRPVQLLMAPRKPERFEEAASALGTPIRRTQSPEGTMRKPGEHRVFLLDTLGELRKAYALADVVVVGRSFSPQWGSDMMEPIALGKPVVIGPNVADFRDTMDRLLAGRGIVQVQDGDELRDAVNRLIGSEEGRELAERGRMVIREQQGATDRHVALIDRLLSEVTSNRNR